MARIYVDNDLWSKEWFRILSPKRKCLVKYLFENCSRWGIIDLDYARFSFEIGDKIEESDLLSIKNVVVFLTAKKLYILDYICFQQSINSLSELKPTNNAHKNIAASVEKYDLFKFEKPGENKPQSSFKKENETRKKTFREEISDVEYLFPEFTPEDFKEFFLFYSESDKFGVMRKDGIKPFDLENRLSRWNPTKKSFKSKQKNNFSNIKNIAEKINLDREVN